jgi:hypothetical protein
MARGVARGLKHFIAGACALYQLPRFEAFEAKVAFHVHY